jgi:hypothetical protein
MKRITLALLASWGSALYFGASAMAIPSPSPVAPLSVPDYIKAAHPDGHALNVHTVKVKPKTRFTSTLCWRDYFSTDDSSWLGQAQVNVFPTWCGIPFNQAEGIWGVMQGADNGWRWSDCTFMVSCSGDEFGHWGGCDWGCYSTGYVMVGHFTAFVGRDAFELHLAYELYGDGNSWAYGWEEG